MYFNKLLFSFLTCLFITFTGASQEPVQIIDWSESVRSEGEHKIIGKSEGFLFVSSIESGRLFSKTPEIYLLKFDESNQFKGDFNLRNIIGKKTALVDIIANESGIILLGLNGADKNNVFLEKIFIDPLTLKITKRNALVKLESEFTFRLRSRNTDPSNILSETYSQDKTKIALIFSRKLKDVINTSIVVFDRSKAYEKINEFELELLSDKKEGEFIKDLTINEDGSMSILLKHYFNNNQIEKRGDKPDYQFLIVHVPTEGDIQEHNIRLRSRFISHARIKKDQAGDLVMVGLYERKQGKGAEGIALFKVNQNNDLVTTKYTKSQAIPRDEERLDNNFELTDFFEIDDTYVLVSREREINRTRNNNDGFYDNRYYNRNFNRYGTGFYDVGTRVIEFRNLRTIIEAIDTSGAHRWVSVLIDNATQENSRHLIENGCLLSDDELVIFNNMHQNNFERIGEEKMKRRSYPNNRNIILQTNVDENGNVSADQLSYPTHFHITPSDVLKIGNRVYICATSSRKSEIMIGSVEVE